VVVQHSDWKMAVWRSLERKPQPREERLSVRKFRAIRADKLIRCYVAPLSRMGWRFYQ
jgi:hypothetical protein